MSAARNEAEDDAADFSSSDSGGRKRQCDDIVAPMSLAQTDFANKFRRLRACARCHRLKMRCVFEDPSFESCTRCFKAGLQCSATDDPTQSQAKRKPRKRSKLKGDGPLAQLQQAINESNKLFQAIQRDEYYDSENINVENLLTLQFQLSETQRLILHAVNTQKSKKMDAYDNVKPDTSRGEASSVNSMKEGVVKAIPSLPWISHDQNVMKELVRLDIITIEEAKARLAHFFSDLHVYWPCVSFPKHYTYDWLLENEPLVLLSLITVTCLNDPDLHDTLLYYLEDNLSIRTSITGNIYVSFIQIYLVLSLWCSPPRKWGSYKHQMSLLMALNLTLCLDLGNEVYKNTSRILSDDSPERQMVRSYMAVYACCGSLGLSLPRFKVVSWTPVHERCCQLLLMGESNEADKFLYFYSKLVALGEEIFQFLCPNGFPNVSVRKGGSVGFAADNDTVIHNGTLRNIMVDYEKRMQKLAMESSLFNSSSKTRNLLSIIYYQLLMTMYDYIVCRVLLRRDVLTEVYLQTLNRLIKASEKVIDSFILLCDQTFNFPTFFYYRPMHALVALIRARLLVKTQQLDFEVDVEQEYEKVSNSIKKISKYSKVANKMSAILTRISKWMKVSSKFNKNGATNSMVDLLNELGKEKAIEKIKINVPTKNDGGDNTNMSSDSRIQFNKFINYGISSMKSTDADSTVVSLPMGKGSNVMKMESPEDRSNSMFVPSPIGYSHSDIMDGTQQSQSKSHPQTQNQTSIQSQPQQFTSPPISQITKGSVREPIIQKSVEQPHKDPAALFVNNAYGSSISQSTPAADNMATTAMQIGQVLRSKTPSLSEASTGAFLLPRTLSITQQDSGGLPLETSTHDGSASLGKQLQQQEQEFLNDIFSQIDTDIMNSEGANATNGLGVAPMFDFLGTCGFQTNPLGGELPIPEDWYKNL